MFDVSERNQNVHDVWTRLFGSARSTNLRNDPVFVSTGDLIVLIDECMFDVSECSTTCAGS
jgi:hypothetical protein